MQPWLQRRIPELLYGRRVHAGAKEHACGARVLVQRLDCLVLDVGGDAIPLLRPGGLPRGDARPFQPPPA
eukprot:752412-Hanusia_phi.AAC.3